MIAPASTADWLQGLTMAALFGGVATTFARTLRLEEPTFDEGNDPHHEHDFGKIEVVGNEIFWKIDYYDKTMDNGSEDPADPSKTSRVLTIMLASEY